ncbi:MAG: hypothetical protein P4L61_01855, partial [Candidatus Pacebacteria bacterium]|nr:hypothetical protein [Candidatus Paceibacterota bacterium]
SELGTQQYDITSASHAGSNSLAISVTNRGIANSTWASNPGGLSYAITQNGILVAASDNSTGYSSQLGSGNATNLSYWHVFWQSIPGAQWIWDSDQGASNHPYPLTPAHSTAYTAGPVTNPIQQQSTTITSINPISGAVGTQVTITGAGFTPSGNTVIFGNTATIPNLSSADGTHITFVVPANAGSQVCSQSVSNNCSVTATAAGSYAVQVQNVNGLASTKGIAFTVTTSVTSQPTVPILNVTLDPSSPVSSTLSLPQSNVTFAIVDLTAGQISAPSLAAIQVKSDSSSASSLSNIRIYQGSNLLGSVPSLINFKGEFSYNWISVSNVPVPANTSLPLRIVADVTSNVSSPIRLGISELNFTPSYAAFTGTPVYGDPMTFSPQTAPSIPVPASNLSASIWNSIKTYFNQQSSR